MKTNKRVTHTHYMLLAIVAAMAVIISAWSMWFLPAETDRAGGGATFKDFKYDVLKSFSILNPAPKKTEGKVNIDDLRSRVFGDTIERAE
ncbi:MAG: hypothetical protein AAB671_00860 [Patescibacteria group bacterium]